MPVPFSASTDQKKSPTGIRWGVFVSCWIAIGYIWLAVLPAYSASEVNQRRWEHWEAQGIDPSATYYSELECHTTILSHWKERQASQPSPVPTPREE
ncbi:hypothetical protein Pla110_36610 [Polystyrenella longa]|uniref:Uncharacterized protein n=1 Tax=Polystyrenella longa TaxID=2528007 RepID=A0A518CRS0_9PLAN|nr:hypothetical protein [Polystyrenella longa]QDU81910.1 hypothetical protein Pla110_36610 [Polystyrenella longa]